MTPEDRVREACEAAVARLRDEVERQARDLMAGLLAAVGEERGRAQQALEAARHEIVRLEGAIEDARREAVEAARAEVERVHAGAAQEREQAVARARDEEARAREEALEAARTAAAHELDQAVARARDELDTERARLQRETEEALARLRAEAAGALEQAVAEERARHGRELVEARSSERDTVLGNVTRLLEGVHALDRAGSLTDILAGLADAAAGEAGRSAVFVLQGANVRLWRACGFPDGDALRGQITPIAAAGLVAEAIEHQEMRATRGGAGDPAPGPSFITLPDGHTAMASPILLSGDVVAVVYADDVIEEGGTLPATWTAAVELLARYGGRVLEAVTAFRTTQVLTGLGDRASASGAPAVSATAGEEEHERARRYARLLVSEIKLYNEAAVREGRERSDLLERLRPEIERARLTYEERVPADIRAGNDYFDEELLRTLAGGDPAVLGRTAV